MTWAQRYWKLAPSSKLSQNKVSTWTVGNPYLIQTKEWNTLQLLQVRGRTQKIDMSTSSSSPAKRKENAGLLRVLKAFQFASCREVLETFLHERKKPWQQRNLWRFLGIVNHTCNFELNTKFVYIYINITLCIKISPKSQKYRHVLTPFLSLLAASRCFWSPSDPGQLRSRKSKITGEAKIATERLKAKRHGSGRFEPTQNAPVMGFWFMLSGKILKFMPVYHSFSILMSQLGAFTKNWLSNLSWNTALTRLSWRSTNQFSLWRPQLTISWPTKSLTTQWLHRDFCWSICLCWEVPLGSTLQST